jgi:(p)ppGpp synthase/HD superfamily hydrolase
MPHEFAFTGPLAPLRDDPTVKAALALAVDAHADQTYGDGPYIAHPIRVAGYAAAAGFNVDYVTAALCHDVIEDSNYDEADLLLLGLSDAAVRGVAAVTRRHDPATGEAERYFDRIALAAADDIGRIVKLFDGADHLRPEHLDALRAANPDRAAFAEKRYLRARKFLLDAEAARPGGPRVPTDLDAFVAFAAMRLYV